MFSIDDYYIGLIIASPDYLESDARNRFLGDVSFDPFNDLTNQQAIIIGKTVLLKKKDNKFIDEEYSIYENELTYELGKKNKQGIILAHIKPFSECYKDDPVIYVQEDVIDDYETLEEMVLENSYYVIYSKLSKKYAVIINVLEPMDAVRYEYFRKLLGEEMFEKMINKTYQKKSK